MADLPDVCVVTHPLSDAGETATRGLLDVLAALTGVALITADLPADSPVRERHAVLEVSGRSWGGTPLTAAVRFLANQVRMCRALAARDEPVVLFYGATAYLLPILAARALGRTVIVEPRGDVPLTLRLQWERTLPSALARALAAPVHGLERVGFRLAHGVVTYTPAMARELGLDPDAPGVYPSGARYVDTDRFWPRVPFAERDDRVGFVGRLAAEKNVRMLARAVRRLPEDVTFVFVGDGALRAELETMLAEEVAAGRVEFRGWVDHEDVPAELSRLRLLVLPSRPTEGLPTVILEALACGTPVYATPVSGVPDVVRDGETGFLMDRADPAGIAAGIRDALERDDLPAVSANGRALIQAEYSFEAAVERYRAILAAVGRR